MQSDVGMRYGSEAVAELVYVLDLYIHCFHDLEIACVTVTRC
jgi:hypothetical protein